nr:pyridine nucleotide-disulfide oxidoreductase [Desulfobacterales bacterium]
MTQRVVIIGAVALGPKAACRLKRLQPEAEVVMIDQDELISYGGCGIPYYISGDVSDATELMSTSFHMLRDERFFNKAKDIKVLTRTRALAIDRTKKEVTVHDLKTDEKKVIPYDKLVLATGSRPRRIPVPGTELDGVFTISTVKDAIVIKERITRGEVGSAVIIGAGAIGLEMAEAFTDLWGIETKVIEVMDQILPGIMDKNLALMAQRHMEEKGVTFYLSENVKRIEGDGRVERVVTDRRTLESDMVIMATGVQPNTDLARQAGLVISQSGAIVVNNRLQTSDPDIYAGGDCVENLHLVTGKYVYFPSGSIANRHGRIIGTNLAGGAATFDGIVASFVIKLFDLSLASAGLSLQGAQESGFDAIGALVVQADRAHFYPGQDLMYLELVVEKSTRRVLGIQGVGSAGDGLVRRVDAVAAVLKFRPTTTDISNMEIAYSPPFAAAMDILNAVGNVADNIIEGRCRTIETDQFETLFEDRTKGGVIFLDVRSPKNAAPYVQRYPEYWINIPQEQLRDRLKEVPSDKRLVLICNSGVRSYEAQVTLDNSGIKDTYNLQGGVAAIKKVGIDLTSGS